MSQESINKLTDMMVAAFKASALDEKYAKASKKTDDGEGMDPVGKGDADIDNDGDSDESDEYLAKRRKAIGKSISKDKKESADAFVIKASVAKSAGKKKFEIGDKEYPVTVKKDVRKESVEDLVEANYTDLSTWLQAALDPAGSDVSFFGGKFKILVGRNKFHTWDTKKGKGSVMESVELDEAVNGTDFKYSFEMYASDTILGNSLKRISGTAKKGFSVYTSNSAQTDTVEKVLKSVNSSLGSNLKIDKQGAAVGGKLWVIKEEVNLIEGFKKGDKVTVKNAKSYDSLAKPEVSGVVGGMNGDKVMVKVGTGSMNVDPKDLMKESVDLLEGAIGDYKELIKFATSDGGSDKGDMLKAAALMAKGDKPALDKLMASMDKYPASIVKEYAS